MKSSILIILSTSIVYLNWNGMKKENIKEKEDLIYLVQEEKLARDVYHYAFNKHGLKIFQNISSSEQYHMDQAIGLLKKYNIENPVADMESGKFENSTLQQLYNDLIARVDLSPTEALFVGATIEDMDIHDIDELIKNTEKEDVLHVYNLLTCGSRNHMRAFSRQLRNRNQTYDPQYISQKEYQSVIEGQHERCGML